MKRLILRIAALGTVVVLGLIAIAQAQRGSEPSSAPPDENPLRRASGPASDGAEPGRIASVAEEASPLREASPGDAAGNPLRPDARLASATVEAPPSPVEAEPSPLRSAADPMPAEGPSSNLGDPFGLRNQPVAEAGDLPGGSAAPQYSEIPDGPHLATAEPVGPPDDRFAGPLGPADSLPGAEPSMPSPGGISPGGFGPPPRGSLDGELMAAAAPVGHPLRDTPSESLRESPPAGGPGSLPDEPAPFEMDAAAGASSIPSSPHSRDGRPGLADARGGAHELAPPSAGMDQGSGQPGAKHLEGPQSPQVTVQKTAPAEVQVGKPAVFQVTVRNTGPVAAGEVQVRDRVPRGTRLVATKPQASVGARGELLWELGTLEPGDEAAVEMQLMPTEAGDASVRGAAIFAWRGLGESAPDIQPTTEGLVEPDPAQASIYRELAERYTEACAARGWLCHAP